MNREIRKQIEEVISKLESLHGEIELMKDDVQEIADMEQGYLDNMPESLQYSSNAERSSEAIDNLGYAIEEIDNVENAIQEAISYLESAKE